jgi:nucleoside-diphosphate-sugar epimerase
MILVTGATGLVGGNLLWQLLQENNRVAAIRRTSSNLKPLRTIFSFYCSNPDDYLDRIDWKIADVLDPDSIQIAMKNCTIVYHCAAVVSLAGSADTLINTNVAGTRNVVQAAIDNHIQKLCFVSSIAACGNSTEGEPIHENCAWNDTAYRSPYSRSKYYSEQEVWKGIDRGLNAIIVNPGVILGVSGTSNGSSQLFAQVRKGLPFYTNGGTGYIDVKDVVKIMIQLVQSEIMNERFVLVSENCSNREILNRMADGFRKRRPVIGIGKKLFGTLGFVAEVLGKLFHFNPKIDRSIARTATKREYYSSEKIVTAIGFRFKPIEQCIREICEFELKQKNQN